MVSVSEAFSRMFQAFGARIAKAISERWSVSAVNLIFTEMSMSLLTFASSGWMISTISMQPMPMSGSATAVIIQYLNLFRGFITRSGLNYSTISLKVYL